MYIRYHHQFHEHSLNILLLLNVYSGQNARWHVVSIKTSHIHTICTPIWRESRLLVYIFTSAFILGWKIFVDIYLHKHCKVQIYRKKTTPNNIKVTPADWDRVLIIRIWLDFYEDDMSPWVLSSIHIQRLLHFNHPSDVLKFTSDCFQGKLNSVTVF